MPSVIIGALRVDVGLNTATFGKGLKQMTGRMNVFGLSMRKSILGAVSAATGALGSLAIAIKGAINEADEMDEAAQKFGMTTEELTKLRYAAQFSAVGFDELGVSLGRLNKNVFEAASGNKSMIASFASVGIAVRNADGSLRGANDVLFDLADRFAAMPDGAQKTGLAMEFMGKSGAQMIPVLNAGSRGLRLLGDEALRAGVVISDKTAKAAGEFNDSLDRLKSGVRGQVLQLTAYLAPAMARIARGAVVVSLNLQNMQAISAEVWDRMLQLAQGFRAGLNAIAADLPTAFIKAFQTILHAAATAFKAVGPMAGMGELLLAPLKEADEAVGKVAAEGTAEFNNGMANASFLLKDAMRPLENIIQPLETASAALDGMGAAAVDATGGGGGGGGGGVKDLTDALEELQDAARQVEEETRTPMEQFTARMEELNRLVRIDGGISWDTYRRAEIAAVEELNNAAETGDTVFSTMKDSFQDTVADLLQGTATIKEGFASMFASIASNAISSGVANLFSGIFGGPGGAVGAAAGGGGGWLSKILGFAGGTNFAPGGLALVGERGPELVNLPRGARVTPNDKLGGSSFTFAPVIDARGADSAAVARAMAEQRAQFEAFRSTFRDRSIAAVSDPRYRGR